MNTLIPFIVKSKKFVPNSSSDVQKGTHGYQNAVRSKRLRHTEESLVCYLDWALCIGLQSAPPVKGIVVVTEFIIQGTKYFRDSTLVLQHICLVYDLGSLQKSSY